MDGAMQQCSKFRERLLEAMAFLGNLDRMEKAVAAHLEGLAAHAKSEAATI